MITLRDITLRRGARVLLQDATATINPGERVALVGRNGAGKSSVFALLSGTLHEDHGSCTIPAGWRVAQVAQDLPESADSATDFVLSGDTRLLAVQQEVQAAEASGDGERMAHAYTALSDAGAHDARARAQALILGLGFSVAELDQAVSAFSGGWRMRLQLARALMCPSDLMLLDEPTNHLDLDALIWLEGWLQRYAGTALIISHDREFLDAVTQVTLHIEGAQLRRYGGNYSQFETLRAQAITLQQAAYARQQAHIAHLQQFISRFKAKATKARQAQSRVKALERLERIAPLLGEAELQFEFATPPNLPNPMLSLRDVGCGYAAPESGATPKIVLHGVQATVMAGQRLGVLGANGRGKSTLIKTIAGVLPVLGGRMNQGKGLRVGYFAQQELDVLRPDESPLQHLVRQARQSQAAGEATPEQAREQALRTFLGTFQFTGEQVMQSVGSMSGGEKARLVLALIVWQRPNLLLLDEPTNHLDLVTREALAMALNAYDGTVMLVSHDRALLRSVCDAFWLVSGGAVQPFEGDLEDYQRHVLDEARKQRDIERQQRERAAPNIPAPPPPRPAGKSKGAIARLRQRLGEIEQRLQVVQHAQDDLHQRLSAPEPGAPLAQWGRDLKALEDEQTTLEDAWLQVSTELET